MLTWSPAFTHPELGVMVTGEIDGVLASMRSVEPVEDA